MPPKKELDPYVVMYTPLPRFRWLGSTTLPKAGTEYMSYVSFRFLFYPPVRLECPTSYIEGMQKRGVAVTVKQLKDILTGVRVVSLISLG